MPARPALVVARTAVSLLGAGVLTVGVLAPAALADQPRDPAGNNGTIKIEAYGGSPSGSATASSPHPGCDFRLQLFGFDENQTGTITFTGQAPTAGAVTQQPLSGSQLLSNDRAGGGQDADAHFDVRGADLGLTGAPAKQGFHVRVQVDADDAPGGAKTKVFWLSCPSAAAPATAPAAAPAAAPAESGSETAAAPLTTEGAPSGAATSATESGTSTRSSAPATTTEQATEVARAAQAPVVTVVGSAAHRSTGRTGAPTGLALPFTGLPAAGLAGLGLAVTTAGGLAAAAGRRRRRRTPVAHA